MRSFFALALLLPAVLALSPPVVQIRESHVTLPIAVRINATAAGARNIAEVTFACVPYILYR